MWTLKYWLQTFIYSVDLLLDDLINNWASLVGLELYSTPRTLYNIIYFENSLSTFSILFLIGNHLRLTLSKETSQYHVIIMLWIKVIEKNCLLNVCFLYIFKIMTKVGLMWDNLIKIIFNINMRFKKADSYLISWLFYWFWYYFPRWYYNFASNINEKESKHHYVVQEQNK